MTPIDFPRRLRGTQPFHMGRGRLPAERNSNQPTRGEITDEDSDRVQPEGLNVL
jgi:hypothetical protein